MAQSLGDLFTKEIKEKLLSIDLALKGIILIKIPEFVSVTYDKYAIICLTSTCNGFIGIIPINTEKPLSGNYITLTKSEYKFFKYDSHVNCDFISDRPVNEIKEFLLNNPNSILGEITDFQHLQITQRLQASKLITPKQKKKYNL